jgi:hypothetical protein
MRTTSKQGQWLGDIAVREAGSIEAVVEMAIQNNVSITGTLPVGTILSKPLPIDRRIMNYYDFNKIFPATHYVEPPSGTIEFVEDDIFIVPDDVHRIEVFLVGGGQPGGLGQLGYNGGGNGGVGGQCVYRVLDVTPGEQYQVIIGKESLGLESPNDVVMPNGNDTKFGDIVALGGRRDLITHNMGAPGEGTNINPGYYMATSRGNYGMRCPFLRNGQYYGSGGGGGKGAYFGGGLQGSKGGVTGGGEGGAGFSAGSNPGGNASFYGAGGGGAGYTQRRSGKGYQGIVIVNYSTLLSPFMGVAPSENGSTRRVLFANNTAQNNYIIEAKNLTAPIQIYSPDIDLSTVDWFALGEDWDSLKGGLFMLRYGNTNPQYQNFETDIILKSSTYELPFRLVRGEAGNKDKYMYTSHGSYNAGGGTLIGATLTGVNLTEPITYDWEGENAELGRTNCTVNKISWNDYTGGRFNLNFDKTGNKFPLYTYFTLVFRSGSEIFAQLVYSRSY